MSRRLHLLNFLARWVTRPMLRRTMDVGRARRDFEFGARFQRLPPYLLHLVDHGPLPLHWVSVRRRHPDHVILFLHGGGYLSGSPATHLGLMGRLAQLTGLQLACPDYRLAPEHPAPAAFDDALAAHARLRALGYAPDQIILGGDSAGGGLALALLAELCARDEAPAGLFAFSPWTDLAMTGESLQSNLPHDPLFPAERIPEVVAMVLAGLDPRDPRISPLHARFPDPSPVFLQVGAGELLRDDSRRMAEVLRQAGGQVILQEWPDCPHVWQMMDNRLPEARAAIRQTADFITSLLPPRSGS